MMEDKEDVPDHLRNHKGTMRRPNLGPEDHVWTGTDGEVDPAQTLAKRGHDTATPLEWLLWAIICAHPGAPGLSPAQRLKRAVEAVTGRKKMGRTTVDESDLLIEIAWHFHCEYLKTGEKPPLRPIVKSVVAELDPGRVRRRGVMEDSLLEKIERDFKKDADLWLARATMDDDYNRMDMPRAIRQLIRQMNEVGIPADENAIKLTRLSKNTSHSKRKNSST